MFGNIFCKNVYSLILFGSIKSDIKEIKTLKFKTSKTIAKNEKKKIQINANFSYLSIKCQIFFENFNIINLFSNY